MKPELTLEGPVQNIINDLQALKEGNLFDQESINKIVDKLKTDSGKLTRAHDKEEKLHKMAPIDVALRKQLFDAIKNIEESPGFVAAVGHQQVLTHTLQEIKKHIKEWESRVEKIDNN